MTRPEFHESTDGIEREEYFADGVLTVDEGFMPLAVRRVLYLLGLAAAALAPVLTVTHPEYGAAILAGSGVLTAAALGTALANPSR